MEFNHKTVLLNETIELLNIQPGGIYVDGTAGGGGCSQAIVDVLSDDGMLISMDQDPDAIEYCSKRFEDHKNVYIVKSNFARVAEVIRKYDIKGGIDGIVLDLGVSSYQLDTPERGFSYKSDAPLDMRMSKSGKSASDLVNSLSREALEHIIRKYGEEKLASRIARAIVWERSREPILTTSRLAQTINSAVPASVRREGNPSKKTFQALRICVNSELDNLSEGLEEAFSILKVGGRIAVITFHSLEDRIVKEKMIKWGEGCICPPDFPVCTCGRKPSAKMITKRSVKPSQEEVAENSRSRSARLRVCERLL